LVNNNNNDDTETKDKSVVTLNKKRTGKDLRKLRTDKSVSEDDLIAASTTKKSSLKINEKVVNADDDGAQSNEDDYWNSAVVIDENNHIIQFSPGQITVGNDSLLDGYTHATCSPGTFQFLIFVMDHCCSQCFF
jgi:hypothetical protein